jgi:hypothetical protein
MASLGYNVREVSLLTSASRTTTQTSVDQFNDFGTKGALAVILDVTATTTGALTVTIDAKDPVSGKYYNLLTGAAVNTVSTNRYTVGPSIAAVANVNAQTYIPSTFRIVVTVADATAVTYSLGYCIGI